MYYNYRLYNINCICMENLSCNDVINSGHVYTSLNYLGVSLAIHDSQYEFPSIPLYPSVYHHAVQTLVNYSGNSLWSECTYQPHGVLAQVILCMMGIRTSLIWSIKKLYSLCDNCTCMEAFVSCLVFKHSYMFLIPQHTHTIDLCFFTYFIANVTLVPSTH